MAGKEGGAANAVAFFAALGVAVVFGLLYDADKSMRAADPVHLLHALKRVSAHPKPGISFALGANVCVDLVAGALEVLPPASSQQSQTAQDLPRLRSGTDVASTFTFFFAAGAAAERTCEPHVFKPLVDRAARQQAARRSLGGNAALMARQLAKIAASAPPAASKAASTNMTVYLGGPIGPDAAALLPPEVRLLSPTAAADEVHLILEYSEGARYGDVAAPRANRFIITADEANASVDALVATIAQARAKAADVLVISGLHMLEPLPADQQVASIQAVKDALSSDAVAPLTVHIELASVADTQFMRLIAELLFPHADSLGFNEQEAAFLIKSLGDCSAATGVAQRQPEPTAVAALLRMVFERFPNLSRLHFHSLAYHVVAHLNATGNLNASGGVQHALWRDVVGAAAAGAVAAATEACNVAVENVTATMLTLLAEPAVPISDPRNTTAQPATPSWQLSVAKPVARWTWESSAGSVTFGLAPVPVCRAPASTVGLGDAISASGLAADAVPRARA